MPEEWGGTQTGMEGEHGGALNQALIGDCHICLSPVGSRSFVVAGECWPPSFASGEYGYRLRRRPAGRCLLGEADKGRFPLWLAPRGIRSSHRILS